MKILYLYPPDQPQTKMLADTIKDSLPDLQIQAQAISWNTSFHLSKYDLLHSFLPASSNYAARLQNKSKGFQSVVTFTSVPSNPEHYRNLAFGNRIIVFTSKEKMLLSELVPGAPVVEIPPCVRVPNLSSLPPSGEVRSQFGAKERMLAVALNEIRDEQQFKTFLYIAREYNRKDDFRFLIPVFGKDRQSTSWRTKLKTSVEMEKLESTILLDESIDLNSLIDSCDIALYTKREPDPDFHFPLNAAQALLAGKPVVCFRDVSLEQHVSGFQANWIARAMEDFVRISRDIAREAPKLEQLSTDLARYSRNLFAPEKVAQRYHSIYKDLLGTR